MSDLKPLRSYGRIKARPLKVARARLIEELLPAIQVDLTAPLRGTLTPSAAVLEIGFGGGEHLVAQAAAAPDVLHLGAEPFLNGVGACLKLIDAAGLANIRIHPADVRDLIAALPPACLSRVDILFPDPWQKARHHKRRLVQTPFLDMLAAHLQAGAEVRFATDWADYARTAAEAFAAAPNFAVVQPPGLEPWPGHVQTRYELKRLGDCAPVFMRFARRA